jgi:hypothetical protein
VVMRICSGSVERAIAGRRRPASPTRSSRFHISSTARLRRPTEAPARARDRDRGSSDMTGRRNRCEILGQRAMAWEPWRRATWLGEKRQKAASPGRIAVYCSLSPCNSQGGRRDTRLRRERRVVHSLRLPRRGPPHSWNATYKLSRPFRTCGVGLRGEIRVFAGKQHKDLW